MGYAEVPHTADLGLRVWSESLAGLFAEAAAGVYASVTDARALAGVRRVSLDADDREALLVDWLSELLYLGEVHSEAFSSFAVSVERGWHLVASMTCHRLAADRLPMKAVTYHGLTISDVDGLYMATVVFDT